MNFANVADIYKKWPELKPKKVQELITWVKKQPQFPLITELEAITFYHSNYCQMEETKATIQYYFTYRTQYAEFFANRKILHDDMQVAMKTWLITMLPQSTEEGYRVIFLRLMDNDPRKFCLNDAMKLLIFVSDAFLSEVGPSNGFLIVADFEGALLGHLLRVGVRSIKRFLYYLQEAFPVRLKGIHIINVNKVVEALVSMMKPFMKKELHEVFYVHSNPQTLFDFVDARILPANYENGTAESVEELQERVSEHLISLEDFFLEEERTKRMKAPEATKGKWGFFGY